MYSRSLHTWREKMPLPTNMRKVKEGRRGAKISEKHQVTIPIEAMRIAGLEADERVIARADGVEGWRSRAKRTFLRVALDP